MSDTQEVSAARIMGQVKWFNNKAGYGFITVNDGEHSGKDIFVHFSTVRVSNSQYKYLTQGEYVEFTLDKSSNSSHELQATDVTGIHGGKLMCEVRRTNAPVNEGQTGGPQRYRKYRTGQEDTRNVTDASDGYERVQRKRRPARRETSEQSISAEA